MRLMPFLAAAVLVAGCGSSDDKKDTTAPKAARGGAPTVSITPRKAGTIDYVCTIHPGQTGAITVTG